MVIAAGYALPLTADMKGVMPLASLKRQKEFNHIIFSQVNREPFYVAEETVRFRIVSVLKLPTSNAYTMITK